MSLLTPRIHSGLRWTVLSQAGQQALRWLTLLVLARWLSPRDFGLFGLAMSFILFGDLVRDMGIPSAIIQRQEASEEFLSTLFWVSLLSGISVMLLLGACAPLLSSSWREPLLLPVLRAMALALPLASLASFHKSLLARRLDFPRISTIEVLSILSGSIAGIGAAMAGAGLWSLVFQYLARVAANGVLLSQATSWRPGSWIRPRDARSVSGYSLGLLGSNLANYGARNADNLLIALALGSRELGFYGLAYSVMLYPAQSVSRLIGKALFPILAGRGSDDVALRRSLFEICALVAFLSFPAMLGLMVVGSPFVLALFGPAWASVIPLIAILAPVGLLQSLAAPLAIVYQVKGRTDILFAWEFGTSLLFVLSFLIGLKWGILGVASSYLVANIILIYPSLRIPLGLVKTRVSEFAQGLWRPAACSMIMLGALLCLRDVLADAMPARSSLALLVSSGILSYALATWCLNRAALMNVTRLLGLGPEERPLILKAHR